MHSTSKATTVSAVRKVSKQPSRLATSARLLGVETEPFIFLGIGSRKPPRYRVQLDLRLRPARSRFQSGDYVQQGQVARIHTVELIVPVAPARPGAPRTETREPVNPTESRHGNPDHGEYLPRERDGFSQDRGISAEVTAPKAIAQHDYRRSVFAVMKASPQRHRQFGTSKKFAVVL